MGVNEEELSPRERADLRARLISGASRMRPASRHRGAWAASAVAVALVMVIAGGVLTGTLLPEPTVAGPAPSTPAPTPTAIPSPSPPQSSAEPRPSAPVPFGGDCERALPLSGVERATGAAMQPGEPSLTTVGTDLRPSVRNLGGLDCWWLAVSDATVAYIGLSVFPAEVVPDALLAARVTVTCDGYPPATCEAARIADGMAFIAAARPSPGHVEMSTEVRARVDASLALVLDEVMSRADDARSSAPVAERGAWWRLPACAEFSGKVADVLGVPLETGFPGDSVPGGAAWEIVAAAGLVHWCSWYREAAADQTEATILELYLQPGAGSPDPAQLSSTVPISVEGADACWIGIEGRASSGSALICVAGENRLVLMYTPGASSAAPEEVAAAILRRLS